MCNGAKSRFYVISNYLIKGYRLVYYHSLSLHCVSCGIYGLLVWAFDEAVFVVTLFCKRI